MAIVAFWVVIIGMLLWEFYSYNHGLTQEAIEHPPQQHFYFYHSNSAPVAPAPPAHNGPAVVQTGFEVASNSPGLGSFTCRVTLKNVGRLKATGVQVNVRPYKGIALGDVDEGGHHNTNNLSDTDPTSLIGQWVTFPDLAPGESATQTAVFIMRREVQPGTNPEPEIIFDSKKADQNVSPQTPPTRPSHTAAPND